VVHDLVTHFAARPADLPAEWSHGLAAVDDAGRMRRIADFIAGMTDRYALSEHARFFDSTPELR
jgi:dGTPase